MRHRVVTLCVLLTLASVAAVGQSTTEYVSVTNRMGRAIPIAVVPVVQKSVNVAQLSVRRCDTDAEVPFYVEPWTVGTDSTVCWVRLTDIPAAKSVTVKLITTPSQTVSKSNGKATFLVFEENIIAARATTERGPYTMWNGTPPAFGSGLIMEARVRAQANGVGLLAYFSNTATMSQGYMIKHDVAGGAKSPDHWRIDGTEILKLSDADFDWNADEATRYIIRMSRDSNIIQRQSESTLGRFNTIRAARPDRAWTWTSFGVAQQSSAPGAFSVDWVRVRPLLDIEPGITRLGNRVESVPEKPVICDSQPALLTGPAGWRSYAWSTGATTRTATITQPGNVTLDVADDNGCTVRFGPFTITRDVAPIAGNDTVLSLCLGRRERLAVAPGFASYRWLISTGQKQSQVAEGSNAILIDSADIYTAIVGSTGGCFDTVFFRVNRTYDTSASITSATGGYSICTGDTLELYALPAAGVYQWFIDDVPVPGATREQFKTTRAGRVSVSVRVGDTSNTCISRASVTVTETIRSTIRIDTSATLCEADTLVIDPGPGFNRYAWYEGTPPKLIATTRVIKVVKDGTYTLQASVDGLCADTASVSIRVLPAPGVSVVSVSGDTSMCIGQTLQLRADGNIPGVVWNTGDTTRMISITRPGTYTARVEYPNGCVKVDSITIRDGLADPEVIAVDKQALCQEADSTRLTTAGKFGSYLWSTGETTDTIWVYRPGTYSVRVKLFECESEGSILIERADPRGPRSVTYADTTSLCEGQIVLPITIVNDQNIPRLYNIQVVEGPAIAVVNTVSIPANASGTVSVRYNGDAATPGVYRVRVRLFDDCQWSSDQYVMYIDYGVKRIDVQFRSSQSQLRTGDDVSLALAGGDNSGLRRFRNNDTVWVSLTMNSDVLEILSATSTCQTRDIVVDDATGRVTYMLTNCSEGTTDPFIEQRVRVLVGTSLNAYYRIDSVRGSNPCFRMSVPADDIVLPITPFGCEVSTIARQAPGIILRELNDIDVLVELEPSVHDVSLFTTDIMGRIIAIDAIRSHDTHRTRRMQRTPGWTYIMAMSAAGSQGVAVR